MLFALDRKKMGFHGKEEEDGLKPKLFLEKVGLSWAPQNLSAVGKKILAC
jgi:hypothetical protein